MVKLSWTGSNLLREKLKVTGWNLDLMKVTGWNLATVMLRVKSRLRVKSTAILS